MAHEITVHENGFAEVAFTGQTPWHGLGQQIKEDATIEEWAVQAGMNWEIMRAPVLFSPGLRDGACEWKEFDRQNVLYRSDNNMPLSIVTHRYKAVQPIEVLDFFRNLIDDSGFKIEVAGTLMGGRRLWAIASTGRFAEVTSGDAVGGYLLLSTSCDRTLATTARFTSVRVVCNNTLSAALGNTANTVTFTHMQEFNKAQMQHKLMQAVDQFGSFMDMAKVLQRQKMTANDAADFVARLVASRSQVNRENYDITKNRSYQRIMGLFGGDAKGSELVGQTKWAMLNAVTEYYDHHAPARTQDFRLNSAWFGVGQVAKNDAVRLLTA